MSDLDEEKRRGKEAEQLLQEPLLVEAFEALDREYTEAWKATTEADKDKRDRIWVMLKLAERVKGHLETVASGGRLATKRIDEIKKPSRFSQVWK